MSDTEGSERDLLALRALGDDAAPSSAGARHVSAALLDRTRRDESTPDLDDAYRHLASCALCRARLVEPPELVEKVAREAERAASGSGRVASVAPVPRRPLFTILAAAAAIALVLGAASLRSRLRGPLGVNEREFVGMMGDSDAALPFVAPEDRDIELSFEAEPGEDGAVAIVDGTGHLLMPVRWFSRGADGRAAVVVAPRMLAPHTGRPFAFVLAGDDQKMKRAVLTLGRARERTTLDDFEALVRSTADAESLRIQRVPIGR